MRSVLFTFTLAATIPLMAHAESIEGEYLEARNADVWTGPCFANGEMGIVGNKAILAWKVTQGIYQDVRLDGLGIAAVVIGDGTFGIGNKVSTKTLFLVDKRASETERTALIAMATALAGDTIQDVLKVEAVDFKMQAAVCDGKGCAYFQAGDAEIRTRCMCARDTICGHEDLFYPALSTVESPYAAYTLKNQYTGPLFGETFRDSNARSAVIGRFAL